MTCAVSLRAPAKLNLFLHVTGRRADGYHNLQTVFQLLDLCDELRFRAARARPSNSTAHVRGRGGGRQPRDDVPRARSPRAAAAPWRTDHPLDKRIPHGGGLGGGSSDAAPRCSR
jgi:4-diphosphocytidyl-2-C-methyl-D-erythritol kinase